MRKYPCGSCARLDRNPECYECTLYWTDARYRAAFDGEPVPTAISTGQSGRRLPLACIHLGGASGAFRECPTCAGTVKVKLFACAVHGMTTLGKALEGVACCETCNDYVARLESSAS